MQHVEAGGTARHAVWSFRGGQVIAAQPAHVRIMRFQAERAGQIEQQAALQAARVSDLGVATAFVYNTNPLLTGDRIDGEGDGAARNRGGQRGAGLDRQWRLAILVDG